MGDDLLSKLMEIERSGSSRDPASFQCTDPYWADKMGQQGIQDSPKTTYQGSQNTSVIIYAPTSAPSYTTTAA